MRSALSFFCRDASRAAAFVFCLAMLVSCQPLSGAQQVAPMSSPATSSPWEMQNSTTKASLRGIHAMGGGVAWASGTDGTVLRTEDGGYMWQSCAMPPGAEKLDFRGIWAWDANIAMVMSSGPGDQSRLYKTTDGCSSWKLLYTNPDKDGFWDAIFFTSVWTGLILGDPVNGSFVLLQTSDGGTTWKPTRSDPTLNAAYQGEGAYAASNSSLVIAEESAYKYKWSLHPSFVGETSFVGVGGKGGSRVMSCVVHRNSEGRRIDPWRSTKIPLASGTDSSGVFSLAFRDQDHGMAVGGDYKKPNESQGTAAWTGDGGKTWTAAIRPPNGYRSTVAWDEADNAWIAAGTNGSDVSFDDGKTWQYLDSGKWNALSLPWVVGPEGRIAKLVSLKSAGISGK